MGLFSVVQHSDEDFSKQVNRLRSEIENAEDFEKEYHKLSKFVNSFFAKKYKVHYKFTYEDLKIELKEKNLPESGWEKVEDFCDKMDKLEFDKNKINKGSILEALNKFSEILSSKLPAEPPHVLKPVIDDVKINVIPEPPQFSDDMPAPPKISNEIKKTTHHLEHDNIKIELPKFEEPSFKKKLSSLITELKKSKNDLEEGLDMINKETKVIEEEKYLIKSKKSLPEFKLFDKTLKDELKELEYKRVILSRKEELISKRLDEIIKLQQELISQSKKIKDGHISLKGKIEHFDVKEKVLLEIKKDMESKYKEAMTEIEKVKKDIKEKKASFTKLQKIYNEREMKLSLEEENLLNEKRKYGKTVSGLIKEHLRISKQDLIKTEKATEELKQRCEELDKKNLDFKERLKKIAKQKSELENAMASKQLFFTTLEKEIKSKDSDYQSIRNSIGEKKDRIIAIEKKLEVFESGMEDLKNRTKNKKQEIELRELDLKSIETQIHRLNSEIKNNDMRLVIRGKDLNKRIASFEEIESKIKRDITREKKSITLMEKKLQKEGVSVSRKLNKFEAIDKFYEASAKKMFQHAEPKIEKEDIIERKIKVTHEFTQKEIGSPYVLEVLSLLKQAKQLINSNQIDESKGVYLEIQKLFDNLESNDREELYNKMIVVFSSIRPGMHVEDDIDNLINKFRESVEHGDVRTTATIYPRLQHIYAALPQEEKGKYYNQIVELGQRIG